MTDLGIAHSSRSSQAASQTAQSYSVHISSHPRVTQSIIVCQNVMA